MEIIVRQRMRPPEKSERELAYGDHAGKVIEGTEFYKHLQDRCTYVAITGQFPSHLRKEFTRLLRQVTDEAMLSSLDGRNGFCSLKAFPFQHLKIKSHPMYLAVRSHLARGYLINPSRGFGTRRPFSKIFLYLERESVFTHQITINADGSVRQGW